VIELIQAADTARANNEDAPPPGTPVPPPAPTGD
jgi:hypothetical protein